jgi:hypothetical protein
MRPKPSFSTPPHIKRVPPTTRALRKYATGLISHAIREAERRGLQVAVIELSALLDEVLAHRIHPTVAIDLVGGAVVAPPTMTGVPNIKGSAT